jgi:hypothetical protein
MSSVKTPTRSVLLAAVLASGLLIHASCNGAEVASNDAGVMDASVPADALPPGPVVYFLVAEWPGEEMHGDSYVLPVHRPEDIEHARALIELGPQAAGQAIAVANVRVGADGINRNLRAAGQPAWSWHVTELIGFSAGTIEILDGWPGWIEDDPQGWMRNTPPDGPAPDSEGTIGFWRYTVVEELDGAP